MPTDETMLARGRLHCLTAGHLCSRRKSGLLSRGPPLKRRRSGRYGKQGLEDEIRSASVCFPIFEIGLPVKLLYKSRFLYLP